LNVNNFDLMEPWDEAALNKLIAAAEDELSLKIRRAKGSNNTDRMFSIALLIALVSSRANRLDCIGLKQCNM